MIRRRSQSDETPRRRAPVLPILGQGKNLELYLRDISRYKPLPSSEELQLAPLIRAGDTGALLKLVNANLRFVVSVARKYQNQGMPLIDLINEGNIGLLTAAKRFDEKKNFKFISYAVWWIRQGILQALANNSRIVRVPLNQVIVIARLNRATATLEQRLHRVPSVQELAWAVGMREADVAHLMNAAARYTSLDAPVWADTGQTSESRLDRLKQPECGPTAETPDSSSETNSHDRVVTEALSVLGYRERTIVRRYFGIGEDTGHTLDQIAHQLNITRERVRQVKEVALNKLRRFGMVSLLKSAVD